MQLKKIKLAGFKSFVDPTTVLLPTNMVAIVGPNGCGKSNIIDAVCWVMGESSAKYLRGESLTDVIFNGASTRKPVGQASVELVFDNQDGGLGGEYASYAEISIRRQISRDSESAYFLNGTRCRRRDIIDIFLGTGLGPRSYSIIGQNMISRIIEAKPDEMRVYLEEAAGVSKYKERRRETENRIQHTKDNLVRLTDVRTELDKQLTTLKRQANAAEKYKIFKQEERVIRVEWLTLQWRELDTRLIGDTLQIQQQATGLEARQAELSDVNLQLDYKREAQRLANETFQEVQRRYYSIGNNITRLEQDIHHHQERYIQWQTDIQQVDKEWLDVGHQLEETESALQDLAEEVLYLEPASQDAMMSANAKMEELTLAEEALQTWQNHWDEFNQHAAKTTQSAQVEQTRIQHLEQKITAITQRQAKLSQEQALFDFSKKAEEIAMLSEEVLQVDEEIADRTQQLTEVNQEIIALRTTQQKSTERLNQVHNELQVLNGQQASLEALQETALGRRNNQLTQWLTEYKLNAQPRLAQGVEVEAGWEYAVERVLGTNLQGVCVDEMNNVITLVDQFKEGSLCFIAKDSLPPSIQTKTNLLLSKVKSTWPLTSLLAGIYVAESLTDALSMRSTLADHESVITREGIWLSASWLRVIREENPEAGVFQREQELKQLAKKIAELVLVLDELEQQVTQQREQLKELEKQREILQKTANQAHSKSAEMHAQLKMNEAKLLELKKREKLYQAEQQENAAEHDQAEVELSKARSTWNQAMAEWEQHAAQRETLTRNRDALREQLQSTRNHVNQAKDDAHQLEMRLQTTKSQQSSLKQSVIRLQTQLATLTERKGTLQNEINLASSIEAFQKDLSTSLTTRLAIEGELNESRKGMESINQELHSLETSRQQIEREIAKLRDALEQLRIDCQGLKVKSETLTEQIKETEFHLEDILKQLPDVASVDEWHNRLEQTALRITRLGAINLVAIEEYTACAERKDYLDKQNADLDEGLATLENAIAKIDRETRARFKETFDKVNEHFQDLFPKVFGGGRAYLELTGDNLLDTGIAVMACPPGKRNSTIHLLSGGEKALTAIALVFSIFHLNPAPFCLLDEVDAPLDDANIGRFCQLVKSMSEKTQFIFISHNKLAIEMGDSLIGVTMHEPGVSRLVSVDMQEAVSLAGA